MTQAVKHTVRLNARVALGTVQPDELELPSRLLSEVLKPGIELDLRHALVRASTWLNTPDRQEWREASQARLLEMAATLEQHPDLKRLFLNKYSDLLEVQAPRQVWPE
jgi:Uma2 family endonuclease